MGKRKRHTNGEKLAIARQALLPGSKIASVARGWGLPESTGLLEWAHILLLLHDPIDLKFSSLIQRVFLMRLEYSDLINNLYSFSKLMLKFSHFD